MEKRFRDLSDDEVVLAYKNSGDTELENEILARYKYRARKLAGELYRKFSFLYQVEYEDVYCIILTSIFLSAKNFKAGMKHFFKYWKSSATRDVQKYVSQFSALDVNDRSLFETSTNGEDKNYYRIMRQNENSLIDEYPLVSDIAQMLEINNSNYKEIDKQIFFLYVEGYSLYEIAVFLNLKYTTIRRRLKKIKDKISDILFNQ